MQNPRSKYEDLKITANPSGNYEQQMYWRSFAAIGLVANATDDEFRKLSIREMKIHTSHALHALRQMRRLHLP